MISSLTVRKIAKLARLKLSEQEELLYTEQLGKIIEYFDELASLDTSEIEPMSHALSISNALRADEVEVSLSHEILLRNAPDIEDEFFKVPRIGE
jgi:aspartyl-tRNA(Asn)/glutamyl-tRNA(Gln) amidotransferase subunit C